MIHSHEILFRYLSVVFDSDFNLRQHSSQVYKSCFYHIRYLRRIRRHISISTAKTITTALISGRLDYCNSLLSIIAKRDLAKLQRVQNCLTREVHRMPRFSPSLSLLQQLHWLPVSNRINFKLSTLTYHTLSTQQPPYLASLISISSSDHQFHNNLLCLKQNFTWANVLFLSLRLGSGKYSS